MSEKRKTTISPSQMNAMDCRLNWYWGYHEGYRPIKSSPALELGIGIHAALDKYYSEGADPVAFFEEWSDNRIRELAAVWDDDNDDLLENKELGMAMLQGYVEEYDGKDNFDVIATEKTLMRRIPVPGRDTLSKCYLVARLDGLVRDHETGKLFSLEHKTFSRFNPGHLEVDHQFTAQVWLGQNLANEMGMNEKVVGVIYNGLRKQKPSPRVRIPLFERHKLYRTEQQINVMLHRAYWQYREFNKPGIPIYPQPNPIRCEMCEFQNVCAEYQRGGDFQFLLDEQFIKRGQD